MLLREWKNKTSTEKICYLTAALIIVGCSEDLSKKLITNVWAFNSFVSEVERAVEIGQSKISCQRVYEYLCHKDALESSGEFSKLVKEADALAKLVCVIFYSEVKCDLDELGVLR